MTDATALRDLLAKLNPFRIRCALLLCPFRPAHDETGCWGECVKCGKRSGFVTSDELEAFAEREIRARLAEIEGEAE